MAPQNEPEPLYTDRIALQKMLFPSFDQLGIVVQDAYKTIDQYCKFGLRPWVVDIIDSTPTYYENEKPKQVRLKIILCFYKLNNFELEIMQPLEGQGYQMDRLRIIQKLKLPSIISHISTHVKSLEEAITEWSIKAIPLIQEDDLGHHKYAYLNTENLLGANLKLIERIK